MADGEALVGALDQGTTSTRFILFNTKGQIVESHQLLHDQIYPQEGWVEHDPLVILDKAKQCIDGCMAKASDNGVTPEMVKAIGITNQRETTVVWDRNTKQPLHNAIVWQDKRTWSTCEKLRKNGVVSDKRVRALTGLEISSYFSGVKLRWLCDNSEAVAKAVADGSAMFGTIDTWLVHSLSAEKAFVTDVTNAGRTMLMNIHTLQWDDEMLSALDIPRNILPEIRSSSEVYGSMGCTILEGTPISGIVGDQQAALIGQAAFEVGQGKTTYGTGCFLIVNTGTEPQFSKRRLLTTPAYKLGPDAPCVYSLEGSIAIGGAAVSWLKDQVNMISKSSEVESLAASVKDTGGVFVVPAFAGHLAPRWREDARGCIVGLTQFSSKAHIARATLAGIAYQVGDVLLAVQKDMTEPLQELRVDGGASVNNLLLQMQADVLGFPVIRPENEETTALGAAFAAGLAVNVFTSTSQMIDCWKEGRKFEPSIDEAQRERNRQWWEKAVERSLSWATLDDDDDCESGVYCAMKKFVNEHPFVVGNVSGIILSVALACAIAKPKQ